jgi:hypothetical protein
MKSVSTTVEGRIIDLHNGIVSALRRSVEDAIEIGQLLEQKKEELPHGEFLPWIEKELPFSERSARNYMQLFRYRYKTATLADLTEAYRVAQLEDQRVKEKDNKAPEPKPEPVRPKGPTINDEEYEHRKEEAFAEKEPPRPIDEIFEDVQKVIVRQENEEVFREFDLAALIDELRRRIVGIPEPNRRHHAINQIIKAMRELAIECDRMSIR